MTIVEYMVYFYSRKEVTGDYAKIIYNSLEEAKLPHKLYGFITYKRVNSRFMGSYKSGWKPHLRKGTIGTAFIEFMKLEQAQDVQLINYWTEDLLDYDKDYKIQLSPKEEILVKMIEGDPMAIDLLTDILESRR